MPDTFRLSYMPSLDGLRGVAVLLVILHHAPLPTAPGGFVGVDIFFVLSGFLITSLLLKEFEAAGTISFKNFYMRRVLRLLPALGVLLVFLNSYVALVKPDAVGITLQTSFLVFFYMSNWAFMFGHPYGHLLHTWSLAIEEQFYILWPLLLVTFLRRLSRPRVLMAVALLCVASWAWGLLLLVLGRGWERVYYGLDTRFWEMLIGDVIALTLASPVLFGRLRALVAAHRHIAHALALLAVLTIAFVTIRGSVAEPFQAYQALTLAALSAGVLIVYLVMVGSSALTRVLEWRPLVYVGRISYGLYLWHVTINLIIGMTAPDRWLVATGLAVMAAALSRRLVEAPLLRLRARFQPLGHS
jgi:peptidoglycan/LPS O-acetylase OafA/YrhL